MMKLNNQVPVANRLENQREELLDYVAQLRSELDAHLVYTAQLDKELGRAVNALKATECLLKEFHKEEKEVKKGGI